MPRILSQRDVYVGWANFSLATVRLPDGKEIQREVEHHGRAVAVLPYDPARRTAILVRQLRVPAVIAGIAEPFPEAPAGRLDEAEPADCARREAMEECGLRLGELEHVVAALTMPAISTEQIDLYLAPYSSSDRIGAGGGLDEEDEHITVVEMPLHELGALADQGQIVDMKTLVLILALQRRRPALFGLWRDRLRGECIERPAPPGMME